VHLDRGWQRTGPQPLAPNGHVLCPERVVRALPPLHTTTKREKEAPSHQNSRGFLFFVSFLVLPLMKLLGLRLLSRSRLLAGGEWFFRCCFLYIRMF
jgi:hypothetical protein